jgi:hypothetical protein
MNLPPGLKVYEPLATEIVELLADWTSEHEWDRWERNPHRPRHVFFYDNDTEILGGMNGRRELHLLQRLCNIGLCESKFENDVIYYRKKPE